MKWFEQIHRDSVRNARRQPKRPGPVPARCVTDIPHEATPNEVYRISVEVVRVTERSTSAGDPCWFVRCKDEDSQAFDVVLWEFQMRAQEGNIGEGKHLTLDVRVPKDGYSAFSLA